MQEGNPLVTRRECRWVIIPCMSSGSRLLRVLVPLILILLILGAVIVWLYMPRMVSVSPTSGAYEVPAAAPVEMSFNVPVQLESLREHFASDPQRAGTFEVQDKAAIFTPSEPWPGGKQITITLTSGIFPAHGLGLPSIQKRSWSFTTAQTLLVYLWPSDDAADIYALDPLTGEVRQLTTHSGVIDFSISWDGLTIYYSTSNSQGGSDLYRLDLLEFTRGSPDELDPEILMKCLQALCSSPQISPDGKLLAYEQIALGEIGAASDIQVWLLSLEDGEQTLVGEANHRIKNPGWSSQGGLAVYDDTRQAYLLYNLATQEYIAFPNETGEPGTWHPDGNSYLAAEIFLINPGSAQQIALSHLLRYELPEERTYDLTLANDIEDAYPLYSPNGSTIAFARKYLDTQRWTPGRQLWLMGADGSDARPLTDEPNYNHYDFAWSPDGDQLAYLRFDQTSLNKPPELWLVNTDGSDPIQLVIGGYNPRWIP